MDKDEFLDDIRKQLDDQITTASERLCEQRADDYIKERRELLDVFVSRDSKYGNFSLKIWDGEDYISKEFSFIDVLVNDPSESINPEHLGLYISQLEFVVSKLRSLTNNRK